LACDLASPRTSPQLIQDRPRGILRGASSCFAQTVIATRGVFRVQLVLEEAAPHDSAIQRCCFQNTSEQMPASARSLYLSACIITIYNPYFCLKNLPPPSSQSLWRLESLAFDGIPRPLCLHTPFHHALERCRIHLAHLLRGALACSGFSQITYIVKVRTSRIVSQVVRETADHMPVRMRLQRFGRIRSPFYRVVRRPQMF